MHVPSIVPDTGVPEGPAWAARCATELQGHSHYLKLTLEVTHNRVNMANWVFRHTNCKLIKSASTNVDLEEYVLGLSY